MKIKQFVSKHKIGLSVVAGALTGSAFGGPGQDQTRS